MNPQQRYQRLQELFERAVTLDEPGRAAFFASECDADLRLEVQSLLMHEAPAAAELTPGPLALAEAEQPHPTEVGPYSIIRVLGEGGFGVVYLAERRSPMVQRVALKVVKPGMDSRSVLRRFQQERQALALMDHANIARVFDAGLTSDGRPYFVMEYVEGQPITKLCDAGTLSIRARLELFIPVCEAIQHAHTKGIIHRDLKPGNILVSTSEGVATPKVIDFGVAKAIMPAAPGTTVVTEHGQLVGTPEYMSPEQAELGSRDIDTRSDIYSLGVILYELLAGVPPFSGPELWSKGFAEAQRIIREVDPPRPSTRLSTSTLAPVAAARRTALVDLCRELRRELEWIPLKALRKSRAERYQSAAELAQDIRNFLAGMPLMAGPESRAYRIRKFVRRRRGPVIAGSAIAVSLLGGTAIATTLAVGQARARAAEAKQHNRAEAIGSFLKELLTAADPSKARGEKVTVRDALDTAVQRLDGGELRGQPLVEAELRATIGATYTNLGLYFPALKQLRAAVAIQTQELGAMDPATLVTRAHLAEALYNTLEDYPGTAAFAEPTFEAARRVLGPDHEETLRAMMSLGMVLGEVGREADGERTLLEAIELHKKRFGAEHAATADAMDALGTIYCAHAQPHKAEPLHRAAWRIHEKALGEDDPRTLRSVQYLGDALYNSNGSDEALACFRRAHEGRLRVLGPDHPDTVGSKAGIGNSLNQLGRRSEGLLVLQECVETFLRNLGPSSYYTINVQRFVAASLEELGKLDEAETMYRDALRAATRAYGPDHYDTTVRLECQFGRLLEKQGKDAEAEDVCRRAFAKLRQMVPRPYPNQVFQVVVPLRTILRRQGRNEEALELGREMLRFQVSMADAQGASPHVLNHAAWTLLTFEDAKLQDPSKALLLAQRAAEMTQGTDPNALDTLALAYHRTGDPSKAVETQLRALSLLPADSPNRAEFEGRLNEFRQAISNLPR